MSPLQRLYESLSGTLPGGFSLWVVILLIVWAIWYFTYRSSGVISPAAFRRWGIYLTLFVVAVYSLQRVRHPAPLAPQRVWVQPFAAPAGGRTEAEQARYALERTLEAARELSLLNAAMPIRMYPACAILEYASIRLMFRWTSATTFPTVIVITARITMIPTHSAWLDMKHM